MSIADVYSKLNTLFFKYCKNTSNHDSVCKLISKAITLARSASNNTCISQQHSNLTRIFRHLDTNIEHLDRCIAMNRNENVCIAYAKNILRDVALIKILMREGMEIIKKVRRYTVSGIAIGLPIAALFGMPTIAIFIVFILVLWNYLWFTRLSRLGMLSMMLAEAILLPFLIYALRYSIWAIANSNEIQSICSELGVPEYVAITILLVLLTFSSISIAFIFYSMYMMYKLRDVFA